MIGDWTEEPQFTLEELQLLEYKKSERSGSGQGSNCLEIACAGDYTVVRDSKNPAGGVLVIGPSSWRRFLATASRDGFRRQQ